jgi:periplasmic protein TonB
MFETVFRMAAVGSSRSDRRWRSLPVSIALHGLVFAFVALLSARTLNETPDPPPPMVFLQGNSPPPPPGDATPAPDRAVSKQEILPVTLIQPDEMRPQTPPGPEQTHVPATGEVEGPATGETSGDPAGRKDGAASGLSGSDGREGPSAGDSTRLFVPGGDVTEPRLLYRVEPSYSEIARKLRLEGVVVLQAIISANGRTEEVRVVQSAHALLDADAVRAVEQWRYRPATLKGRPVRVSLTVTVEFRLR